MTKLAVIGCGTMGSAIVRGLIAKKWCRPTDIIASHPDPARAEAIGEALGVPTTTDNAEAAARGAIVLLGVKPQIIKAALSDLRGKLDSEQLVISIAAGISTRYIETYTDRTPVVRSMPNLPVTVGAGATAIASGAFAQDRHIEKARQIFSSVGTVEVIPEYLMDAVTGLSGTGPMYVFHMLEALADAGVRMGMNRDAATRMSVQTLKGSALLLESNKTHPAALKDQVTSPGGTAIAALHVLRREAFAAILMDAVEAATRRSAQLGE